MGVWALCLLALAAPAQAIDAAEARESARDARLRAEAPSILDRPSIDFPLPLDFRARFAGTYTRNRYASDALAVRSIARVGPALRGDHFFASRVAVVRPVWEGVELEVAWASESFVSGADVFDMNRHSFGAFIRFSH